MRIQIDPLARSIDPGALGGYESAGVNTMSRSKTSRLSFYWQFFGLTFLLTWACWLPAALISAEQYGLLSKLLHYAGGLMPTLVTLLLLYIYGQPQEKTDYWRRLIDLKRIKRPWFVVIMLSVPFLTFLSVALDITLSGEGAQLEAASSIFLNPLSLIPFAIFMLLFGPLPEEMAWRGYALDVLQDRWNALSASLILGVAWTVWHLPLFIIEGTYQHGLGVGTPQFWLYMLDKVPQSIVMTWIFNNNQRSTAAAVLFHFMVNFVGELFGLALRAEVIYIASWWIMALLVIAIWKPQRFVQIRSRN